MESFRTVFVFIFLAIAAPAAADQKDGRLDGLFAELKAASDHVAATPIERQIWTIWLENEDKAVAGLMDAGVKEMGQGDHQAALKTFDKLVSLAPDFAEAWNKRATVHYLLNNLKESLADIAKTLALEPRHFGALSGRGLVYARLEDMENALDSFEAALEVNPQMIGPRINAEAIRRLLKKKEI